MKPLLSISLWIGYNLLDALTTHAGIASGYAEANPLPALVVRLTSPQVLAAYKLALALLWLGAVAHLARRRPRVWLALKLANILIFLTVLWNSHLIGLI